MNIKQLTLTAIAAATGTAMAAMPEVSNVTMTQAANRLVTITYQLTEAAVVTLDIQTNANVSAAANDPGWTSIGGEVVCNAQGDVWKQVSGKATYTITWQPDQSWKGPNENGFKIAANGARARVTAWPLDNTPDYMVVDISAAAQPNTQRYYPGTDFIPGGILGKPDYRTTTLVMRKIMAKDVTWTMGSVGESGRNASREATHPVTLANNYYISVFLVTQTQWQQITGYNPSNFTVENSMRPVEKVSYTDIRQGKGTASSAASATAGVYPADPYGESFLGLLRSKSGLDFDLPSEAQWEFAARAGHGEGYWGDGSVIRIDSNADANLALLGRYQRNGGQIQSGSNWNNPASTCGTMNGSAVVGSYKPNDWGLYDMHGNVWEWCLDLYADNISAFGGAVNTTSGSDRVRRGGGWPAAAPGCRAAYRAYNSPASRNGDIEFRVSCTAGLR